MTATVLAQPRWETARGSANNENRASKPTSGFYVEEMQSLEEGIMTRYLHPHVHCSISHSSQDMEATQVSMDRRWVRRCGTYICGIIQA